MFPIRDDNPTRHRPLLTVLVIVACTVIFFGVQPQNELEGAAFLYENAAISCEIFGLEPLTTDEISTGRCGLGSHVEAPAARAGRRATRDEA